MRCQFERVGAARFRGSLKDVEKGAYTIQLDFDGTDYPFELHCRYMRHKDGAAPYTFPNMEFADAPPGVCVGPWPGWRGIPEMPVVKLELFDGSITGRTVPVRFQFWGDELDCRRVRGIVEVEVEGDFSCNVVPTDGRLVPVSAELFQSSRFLVEPVPVSLQSELVDTYPRLLFTGVELARMIEQKETTHRPIWSKLIDLFGSWHLSPDKTPESKAVAGPERLFGEDRVVLTAFRALLDPSVENIEFARSAFFEYIELTERDDFEPLRIDTQSGETLFTLCIGFDWLHSFLEIDERERARRRLFEVADVCWGHLGYERNDYGQAHFLGCGMGLLAFSFLFWEAHPRAREWASYLRGTFQRVLDMLPDDGFYPHGINLWIYEYGFLLRWLELFRVCAGDDLWHTSDHWRNASDFRAFATSPDLLHGVTIGDPQYRVGGDSWCHYLIAARTGSREAQWLAERLADGPHAGVDFRHIPPRRRVYEFIYHDPAVSARDVVAKSRNFEDGGQVFIRSPWKDGSTGSLFTFRSGPPIGRKRREGGEQGAYGHSDPANGSFLLYRDRSLLVSGPGPTYRRDTALHNTITIGGKGQIGDATVWLPDFFPPDVIPPRAEVRTDGMTSLLFADLTPAYLPHLQVKKCTRSMLVKLDTAIVGVDTVVCSEPSDIEWNLHSWGRIDAIDLHVLAPADCFRTTGLTEGVPAYPNDGTRDYFLRLTAHEREVTWVWCIGLSDGLKPEIADEQQAITINGLPGGRIRFDGKWLMPDRFDEA